MSWIKIQVRAWLRTLTPAKLSVEGGWGLLGGCPYRSARCAGQFWFQGARESFVALRTRSPLWGELRFLAALCFEPARQDLGLLRLPVTVWRLGIWGLCR
jgi:hypothetical protein